MHAVQSTRKQRKTEIVYLLQILFWKSLTSCPCIFRKPYLWPESSTSYSLTTKEAVASHLFSSAQCEHWPVDSCLACLSRRTEITQQAGWTATATFCRQYKPPQELQLRSADKRQIQARNCRRYAQNKTGKAHATQHYPLLEEYMANNVHKSTQC